MKVQYKGETIEVDEPEGYVKADDLAALKKNLAIARRNLKKAQESSLSREALMDDEEFVSAFLDHHGIPHEGGKLKLPEDLKDAAAIEDEYRNRLKTARQGWEAKEIAPRDKRIEALEGSLGTERSRSLRGALEQGGVRAGLLESMFEPLPFGNGKYAPVHAAADNFTWSDEVGNHVLHEDGEPVYDSAGNPITPGVGYWNHVKETVDEPTRHRLFGDNRQRGNGMSGRSSGGSKPYQITRTQARDRAAWTQAEKAAEQAGLAGPEIISD